FDQRERERRLARGHSGRGRTIFAGDAVQAGGGVEDRKAEAHRRRKLVAGELREKLRAARELSMARGEHEMHRLTLRDAGVRDVQRDTVEKGQPPANQRLDESDLWLRIASLLTPRCPLADGHQNRFHGPPLPSLDGTAQVTVSTIWMILD